MTAAERGRKGGKQTLARYGPAHFRAIGARQSQAARQAAGRKGGEAFARRYLADPAYSQLTTILYTGTPDDDVSF